jgi:RimJ/RimL family protein N-acetyltransferase
VTLIVRPLAGPDELELFNRLPYLLNDEVAGDLAADRRRLSWLWVALRDDRVVARAGWWSLPGDERPTVMDIFDVVGSPDDGLRLLETALAAVTPAAAEPPEYVRFVPPDWRADETRWMTVLERSGARLFVERLRLEWRPGAPVPPPGQLRFRPVGDPAELIDLMTLVLDGTLDAHSQADLRRLSAREAAEEQYREELSRYGSPRDWWRIAELADGSPAGFVIPAHNDYNPIIAYLGVVPAHRGRGLIDEVLAEGTRILAAQQVPRIRASTDVGNTPMAAAFARAGYVNFGRRVDLKWSGPWPSSSD